MADRAARIAAFLEEAGWQDAHRMPLAGDMSPRRYARLSRVEESAILMDADDPQAAFVAMTGWLRDAGLSAPEVLAGRPEEGLLLLEDLGDRSVKAVLTEEPALTDEIFSGCVDLLAHIRQVAPPPLPCPDAAELVRWTELADAHYPGIDPARLSGFRAVLRGLLEDALRDGRSVSLRDFHSENLMWLPEPDGVRRFGLLDYQDAFLTHPAYDLVSLLTDARTEIDPARREAVLAEYLEVTGDAPEPFRAAFAALSAQRNLRILGIFARSGRHLDALPRTWRYFREALDHPAFDAVRAETLAALPPPKAAA